MKHRAHSGRVNDLREGCLARPRGCVGGFRWPLVGSGELVMLKVYSRNLGDVAILSLQGRLISGETRSLRDAVSSQSNVDAIVLDLSRVTAIDARGLGIMLDLRRQSCSRGIHFRLMNVNKFTRRVLEVTRLDSVFEIIPRTEPSFATARPGPKRAPVAACA